MNVLFISWDGPGSNYHESLFLPIFARSRRPGDEIHLLQYAWDADERTASVREAANRLGMPYSARPVWRTPQALATVTMIIRGAFDLVQYVRRHRIDVLMPRSIIPAGMALLAQRSLPHVRLLYDADGLMADERADFAGWSREGKPYRALRAVESTTVRRADVVMTRTHRAKRILAERAGLGDDSRIVVVSNGKDAEVFQPGSAANRATTRQELDLSEAAPLLIYAGSIGPHYHPDRMIAFAAAVQAKRADAHFLILTGFPELAHECARTCGLDPAGYTVRCVPPLEIPRYLAAADVGLAFRSASLSQQAVAPIKVGEYLLCGLPVLSTSGVGDLDEQLNPMTGRLLDRLDDSSLDAAANWFIHQVLPAREQYRDSCRQRGIECFSLDRSVAQYREAFGMIKGTA